MEKATRKKLVEIARVISYSPNECVTCSLAGCGKEVFQRSRAFVKLAV